MSKPIFAVNSGPDAAHWMHTVTLHNSYAEAMTAYDDILNNKPRWSAVIIRIDDQGYEPGKRTLKRQNQYNYGHAAVWCDEMNRRLAEKVLA